MSNIFTLEDLVQEMETRYAPFVFRAGEQEFTLQSLMLIERKQRDAVTEKLRGIESDESDEDAVVAAVEFALSTVTVNKKGPALIRLLGHDLPKLMILLEKWQAATQPGEASSSSN